MSPFPALRVDRKRLATLGVAMLWLQACAGPAPALRWQSKLELDHPLVGRIVEPATGRELDESALLARLSGATVVVLGEQHDNPDHHRLQARVIEALAARRKRPAVVFEMIELQQQARLDAQLAQEPHDVDALARVLDWAHSGWPAWSFYRPVFAAALKHELPVRAGSLDRNSVMQVARKGIEALEPDLVQRYGLAGPPPDLEALRSEMREAHCGMLPEKMIDAMVLVQRARDATLAEQTQAAQSALLITGNGHARRDRGVPHDLSRVHRRKSIVLAFLEVRPGLETLADYARTLDTERLPYDYVWFTPRGNDEDHCAELRKRFSH